MQILIVKTSSLGDLFHALPTVHLLKQAFGADVDWVVNSVYVPVAECFTDVRRVIPFPRRNLFPNLGSFRSNLRKESYDMVVDLQGLVKSALICRMARRAKVSKIIGPSFQREGARLLYTDVVGPKNKNRHAIEENLDILRWLGKPFQPLEFPVRFPDVDFKALQTQPLVVFAPCSRHAAKNWPAERFAEMGRLLELPVVLVGAPDDAATCQSIADGIGAAAVNMAGKTTLLELGGILQSADLVVTVDSGPMHIAAATGTPCLAIFGPTDPVRVGPYGPQHRVVRDLSLGPADGNYSKSDLDSIRKISVEQVVDAVREMLSEK